MDDQYVNKQTAYQTVTAFTDRPEHRAIWNGHDPAMFGVRYGEARSLIADLLKFTADLGSDLSGARQDKELVQNDLVTAVLDLGNACAEWFGDHGDATNQAQITFTPTQLLAARDQAPADAAVVVLAKANAILARPADPVAPGAFPPAHYGITPAAVEALDTLKDEYNALISTPAALRKLRKGKREQVPARFRAVDAKLESADRFIVQFRGRKTDLPEVRAAKDAFVDGWFAARRVDQRGHGPAAPATPPPSA